MEINVPSLLVHLNWEKVKYILMLFKSSQHFSYSNFSRKLQEARKSPYSVFVTVAFTEGNNFSWMWLRMKQASCLGWGQQFCWEPVVIIWRWCRKKHMSTIASPQNPRVCLLWNDSEQRLCCGIKCRWITKPAAPDDNSRMKFNDQSLTGKFWLGICWVLRQLRQVSGLGILQTPQLAG